MPTITVPPGPPPEKLVVEELRGGSGPGIEEIDDEILVKYAAADYTTREEFFNSWKRFGPSTFLLEETRKGWEIGLMGMQVGARRKLFIPSKLAYGTGAMIYIVELVALNGKRA